jgi:flagellar motor switch protein FliG
MPVTLTGRQKAAIIVRLLLSEGVDLPLTGLPDHLQAALTEQIGQMRLIRRDTMRAVIEEFMVELDAVGLALPGGIDGALKLLEGKISPTAADRLRRLAGASAKADPWDRIMGMEPGRLVDILKAESVEVGAVMLSKLPVARSAELLGALPGDKARRIAYAVSLTGEVDPETVRRIGQSIVSQLDALPPRAFDRPPVERVGAILNQSPSATRDDVLEGLDAEDADFAGLVRKAIFTFAHIPERLEQRDVPRVLRAVDQAVLVTALAAGQRSQPETTQFLLSNMSQRMADNLREEMAGLGRIREKDAELAMAAVVNAIRSVESAGEITLKTEDEEED